MDDCFCMKSVNFSVFYFFGVEGGRLEVNVLVSCSKMGLDFYWLFFFKTFIMVITLFGGML